MTHQPPPPAPDGEQQRAPLLALIVCDQDRGESPFGWSTLPHPEPATRRTPR